MNNSGLSTFAKFLLKSYAENIAFIIINALLGLLISFTISTFNGDVKAFLQNRIQYSVTVNEARKAITKYINVPIVEEQIAFLRTDGVLREGRSQPSPAITPVSEKTVLSILQRKGNWLQVQIETDNYCIEGWVEESKVVKFKKVNK